MLLYQTQLPRARNLKMEIGFIATVEAPGSRHLWYQNKCLLIPCNQDLCSTCERLTYIFNKVGR